MTVHFLRISTDYAYPQGRYPKLRMIVIRKRWKTSENTRKTTKKTQKNSGRLTPARKTLGIKNPGNFFRDPQNPGNFSPGFPGLPWEKCHTGFRSYSDQDLGPRPPNPGFEQCQFFDNEISRITTRFENRCKPEVKHINSSTKNVWFANPDHQKPWRPPVPGVSLKSHFSKMSIS